MAGGSSRGLRRGGCGESWVYVPVLPLPRALSPYPSCCPAPFPPPSSARPKLLCYLPLPPDLTTCHQPQSALCVVCSCHGSCPRGGLPVGGAVISTAARACVRRAEARARGWEGCSDPFGPCPETCPPLSPELAGGEGKGHQRLKSGPSGRQRLRLGTAGGGRLASIAYCFFGQVILLGSLLSGFQAS